MRFHMANRLSRAFVAARVARISVVFFLALAAAFAQVDRGAISGVVLDPSKAPVANASVTLRNRGTGVKTQQSTDQNGNFLFENLPVGTFDLACEAQGFKRFVESDIHVDVGRTANVTLGLEIGAVAETVSVQSSPTQLDTESSDIGTSVSQQHIINLPLPLLGDLRNPVDFVLLTPGVTAAVPGSTPDLNFHFSGAPSDSFDVYIDGIPDTNPGDLGNTSTNHPSVEAINEFRTINNNPPAEYGLSTGIISFTFKSGTNQFHGDAFEFLQNDHLDALDYVTKALGGTKAPYKQNEYGGTFGGPVWIPKVYKGTDHTFFFVSYTGFKYRPSSNTQDLTTIPNAFRSGDFSSLLGPQLTAPNPNNPSQMLPVFDPAGRPIYAGQIYNPESSTTVTGPNGQQYVIRNPFPGNTIPQGAMNSSALKILPLFPQATNNGIYNNYFRNTRTLTNDDRTIVKLDHYFGNRNHLSGSVDIGSDLTSNNGNLSEWEATETNAPTHQFRLSDNQIVSPTLVNTFSAGFLRDNIFSGAVQAAPSLSSLGLLGINTPPGTGLPAMIIQNVNTLGGPTNSTNVNNRYIVNDTIGWQRGAHNFKFGGEIRKIQQNQIPATWAQYTFEPQQTALNGTGFVYTSSGPVAVNIPVGTGNAVASFLTGAVGHGLFVVPAVNEYLRWSTYSAFVQDDWKVNRTLTLNLGVRYDLPIPMTEKYGNVSNMNPSLPNPAAGGLPGAYTFYGTGPGRNGQPRVANIDYKEIQPRVGFAYSPDVDNKLLGHQRTVFRSGFAIDHTLGNQMNVAGVGSNNFAGGFTADALANAPNDAVGSPAFFLNQPFPGFTPPPFISPTLLTGDENPTWMATNSGMMPTELNWTFEVQRELPGSFLVSAAYVGTHIYHLGLWRKPNQIDPAVANKYQAVATADGLTLNGFMNLPITDPRAVAAGLTPPFPAFVSLFGSGATVGQALRPFPQYASIDGVDWPIGSTHYNGLQTRVQKRFSQGLTLLVSYSWSKTIGDADSDQIPVAGGQTGLFTSAFQQNFYNEKAQETITSTDIPQAVVLSYTYELPIGPGRKFLHSGGVSGKVFGGWSVSGLQSYQSGAPIHIEFDQPGPANTYDAADGYSFTPDIVLGQPLINPSFSRNCAGPLSGSPGRSVCQFYINPLAFTAPPVGQFGNADRYMSGLRTFPFYNEDFSIIKDTALTERVKLQFQANFFNMFNRVVLGIGTDQVYNLAPTSLSSATLASSTTPFGIPTYQQNGPRRIQFALKLIF